MRYRKTNAVARLLKMNFGTLNNIVRQKRIPAPERTTDGTYLWSEQDVENVRELLRARALWRQGKRALATAG